MDDKLALISCVVDPCQFWHWGLDKQESYPSSPKGCVRISFGACGMCCSFIILSLPGSTQMIPIGFLMRMEPIASVISLKLDKLESSRLALSAGNGWN